MPVVVVRFEGCELDLDRLELRRDGVEVPVEPQVFDVLAHLLRNRGRVVSKHELLDEVWGTRFVTESALASRIMSARRAVGDTGRTQRVIRTIHGRGYRFIADVDVDADTDTPAGPGPDLAISFVTVRGGVSLAVGATGEGPPLVKAATWMTQVDKDSADSPVWGHWVRALSRHHRYVRYDPRGCGLSDRDLRGIALDDLDLWVEDLEAVVAATLDTTGAERVALLGVSQGGPVSVAFAVRHPELVSHLVLFGTYARGMRRRGDPHQTEEAALLVDLARVGWQTETTTFREVFARQFVPKASPEEIDWFNDQLRLTTDATNAPQLEQAFHDLDVSDLAKRVAVPTLVLHAVGDQAVPFEEGRRLAGLVPGARFVPLDSDNHILLERDTAFGELVAQVDELTGVAPAG